MNKVIKIKEVVGYDTCKKVGLYPNEVQEEKLYKSVGTARFIYNCTLNRQEENYSGGKFISYGFLRKEII